MISLKSAIYIFINIIINGENMSKLKTMLLAIIFASATITPSLAGSGEFAGPYISVSASSMGAQLSGSYTDSDSVVTEGTGGKVFAIASAEIGYTLPLGDKLFITAGASYTPGEGEISKSNDTDNVTNVNIKASDFYTYFISPGIAVSENSALYVKYGSAEADLKVVGDYTGTASSELSGETLAMGLKTMLPSGLFFSSEVGFTEYDGITINDIGDAADDDGEKGDAKGDPTIAYGTFAVGFRF